MYTYRTCQTERFFFSFGGQNSECDNQPLDRFLHIPINKLEERTSLPPRSPIRLLLLMYGNTT